MAKPEPNPPRELTRRVLNQSSFRRLIRGEVVELDGFEILLSDIGVWEMERELKEAMDYVTENRKLR